MADTPGPAIDALGGMVVSAHRVSDRGAPLTRTASIVVISDRIDRRGDGDRASDDVPHEWAAADHPWRGATGDAPEVAGGYLERLPLACIAAGMVEQAEIWHHQLGGERAPFVATNDRLGYRAFSLDDPTPPCHNRDMIAFVRAFGAPHILVIYGLGVSTALLDACANSIIV